MNHHHCRVSLFISSKSEISGITSSFAVHTHIHIYGFCILSREKSRKKDQKNLFLFQNNKKIYILVKSELVQKQLIFGSLFVSEICKKNVLIISKKLLIFMNLN